MSASNDVLWLAFRSGFMASRNNELDSDMPVEMMDRRELDHAVYDRFESWLNTPSILRVQ